MSVDEPQPRNPQSALDSTHDRTLRCIPFWATTTSRRSQGGWTLVRGPVGVAEWLQDRAVSLTPVGPVTGLDSRLRWMNTPVIRYEVVQSIWGV